MAIYKTFTSSSISKTSFVNVVTRTLTSESVSRFQFLSGSLNNEARSYYDSLRSLLYLSGSKMSETESRFTNPALTTVNDFLFPGFHTEKFHKTGSILSINSHHYGESIKRKSFELIDNSTSKTVYIKDDGFGNLYAASASISQSNLNPSSSLNYVGNILYGEGLVVITETGSWSSSIDYTDITSGQFSIHFDSMDTIYTSGYSCNVAPNEFNNSSNPTLKAPASGGVAFSSINRSRIIRSFATSSKFTPVVSEIGLYNDKYECLAIAKLSQPVKIRNDIDYTFKVKLDM